MLLDVPMEKLCQALIASGLASAYTPSSNPTPPPQQPAVTPAPVQPVQPGQPPAYDYDPSGDGHGPVNPARLTLEDKLFLYSWAERRADPGVYARVLNATSAQINLLKNEAGSTHAAQAAHYNYLTYTGWLLQYVKG